MPQCEDCGHSHTKTCGCGCTKEACERCEHHHGSQGTNGTCAWCGCSLLESTDKKEATGKPGIEEL